MDRAGCSLRISFILLAFFLLTSCADIKLKTKKIQDRPYRVGVLGFRITAPIKKLGEIQSEETKTSVKEELIGVDLSYSIQWRESKVDRSRAGKTQL